jgi:hypothetical protein
MFRLISRTAGIVALWFIVSDSIPAMGQYAASVVSYDAGTTPTSGYSNPFAALGEPSRFIAGSFPSVVSPFSPPYRSDQIVSVGENGQLTLRLSNYAIPDPAGPEIGLFANVGIVDVDYDHGQAGAPATTFGTLDSAMVEVSRDGSTWVGLGSALFDVPTNGYIDLEDPYVAAPGSGSSDFQKPFTGSLSSFDGLPYFDNAGEDMLDLLAGSGGGRWIDISTSGLAQVGYVRLSLADDGLPGTSLNFELDAVSIARDAVGTVVPEPSSIVLLWAAVGGWMLSRSVWQAE